MVRQSRVRTAAEISNSFGPQQSSNVHESSYLTNLGVGDRIPGFRTSAGMQLILFFESACDCEYDQLLVGALSIGGVQVLESTQ